MGKAPYNARVNFRFSWKISVTCLVLAATMVCLSRWQWHRHIEKQELISRLTNTLKEPLVALGEIATTTTDWLPLTFHRVTLEGDFDFAHEVILRNRRFDGRSGAHVITPLKVAGTDRAVLVDRGFIPLGREGKEKRRPYQKPSSFKGFGLIKESSLPKLFGPSDPPTGLDKPWADEWLRVNVAAIQGQIPYPLLPIYIEVMEDPEDPFVPQKIVRESSAGRDDMLVYSGQKPVENFGMDSPEGNYPIPVYDTTTPPDIHLGYVYEWLFMALLTIGIGVIAQLKRAPATTPN